jgi:acyl-CoA synthetase (AMP-forming)/AMP-acid ligase II
MISRMLQVAALANPGGDAIAYLDRRVSYRELYQSALNGADGLRLHGVSAGDTVILALNNCPEFVMVYYAAALLHAKVYAIDPNAADPELRRCIRDAEPALVVTHAMRAATFRRLLAERADLRARIAVIEGERGTHLMLTDLFAGPATSGLDMSGPVVEPYPGDWSVTYSSGSTGTPKRICRTQRNQVAEAEHIAATAAIRPRDRILCTVPLFHALGQFCCMITAVRAGATLVLLEQTGPPDQDSSRQIVLGAQIGRVLEMIEKHKATIVPAVPYVYELLADVDESHHADVSSVRLFLSGGNFLPPAIAERFARRYGKPVRQTYGSSEAGSVAWDCRDPERAVSGSAGHPLDGVEVRLVDPYRRPVPSGSVGEVAVRAPSVMTGYDGRPDLTAQVISDGFYYTGDIGMIDEDGRLHITGRLSLLIDTGGHKVNPLEVEEALIEHPQVREAVLTSVGTQGGDEILVAVVVAAGPAEEEELLSFCRARLTDYKVPHRIIFRDALPRSPLGKVLRRDVELAEFTTSGETAAAAGQAGDRQAATAGYLVGQLSRLLQMPAERIDTGAPILATGINSLMAMQLRLAIERDLGRPAQLGMLLGTHSLGDVAALLTGPKHSPGAALMPVDGPADFALSGAQLPYADAVHPWAVHSLAARVEGSVDEAVLRAAFQELVNRHPMLRLEATASGDGWTQRIAPRCEVDFAAEDVACGGLADRIAALEATAAVTPGAGGTGPLRIRLLRDGDGGLIIALCAHKVAIDRWSFAVLLRDLAMVLGGRQPGELYLPTLPYTYRDYVHWSAGQPAAAGIYRESAVGLPVRVARLTFGPDLAGPLRELAHRERASVPDVLLAALATAADGDTVGAVHWGRDRPEFHDLVGRFARVVPIPGDGTVRERLPAVREALAGPPAVLAMQPDVVFADDIGPRPALQHLIRFSAGRSSEPIAIGGARLHPVELPARPLAGPIECRVTRAADGIVLLWRYAEGIPASRIDDLSERLRGVLGTAAAPSRRRITEGSP